ncbi:RNA polymerase sigma factor [Labilibaculum euxinus]|uniref:Sigma-70 family RNA polymerase sigma factor n=1 Tax=Labilibaculum euxinus TaxID=2686357 RepID=A0A7M4D9D4_9BACT|nr:sigma-70 family RNA polymerase sigma factor [Labilibaculum euxinus]MUP39263.1 sigma-70 family RNA polymerase sigma factor [Labilibaculum euxinus]MVB08468.1 sigma-70 family RNA polymerase sigma factor [Labilibaculum euxinus]
MTDSDLKEKFISVFEENIGIILKISRAYTKTTHDREDLINDIALELWKSYPNFKGDSKISTWIYRISLNTSMNYRRKDKSNLLFFSETNQFDTSTWLQDTEVNEQVELLYDCIDDLTEFNKAIIILYLDGNSHDEISTITGISKTNVGTRISRIKEQIKKNANSKK